MTVSKYRTALETFDADPKSLARDLDGRRLFEEISKYGTMLRAEIKELAYQEKRNLALDLLPRLTVWLDTPLPLEELLYEMHAPDMSWYRAKFPLDVLVVRSAFRGSDAVNALNLEIPGHRFGRALNAAGPLRGWNPPALASRFSHNGHWWTRKSLDFQSDFNRHGFDRPTQEMFDTYGFSAGEPDEDDDDVLGLI